MRNFIGTEETFVEIQVQILLAVRKFGELQLAHTLTSRPLSLRCVTQNTKEGHELFMAVLCTKCALSLQRVRILCL